jgi:hypothetical protein
VVFGSDTYAAGLVGLLDLHWQLPGYQSDFFAPGGTVVFELLQSKSSKESIVRISPMVSVVKEGADKPGAYFVIFSRLRPLPHGRLSRSIPHGL